MSIFFPPLPDFPPAPPLPPTRWATVYATPRLISVDTDSGYGRTAYDDQGVSTVLPREAEAEALGTALIAALDSSRMLLAPEVYEFMDRDAVKVRVDRKNETLMSFGSYADKRALFKDIRLVLVRERDEEIFLTATKHRRGDDFQSIEGTVQQISRHAPKTEIGNAVLEIISLCQ